MHIPEAKVICCTVHNELLQFSLDDWWKAEKNHTLHNNFVQLKIMYALFVGFAVTNIICSNKHTHTQLYQIIL